MSHASTCCRTADIERFWHTSREIWSAFPRRLTVSPRRSFPFLYPVQERKKQKRRKIIFIPRDDRTRGVSIGEEIHCHASWGVETFEQMSRMLRLELVGLVLLACTQILTEHRDFYEPRAQYGYHSRFLDPPERATREVRVKQGRLRGIVVQPRTSHDLQSVDVFLGKFHYDNTEMIRLTRKYRNNRRKIKHSP